MPSVLPTMRAPMVFDLIGPQLFAHPWLQPLWLSTGGGGAPDAHATSHKDGGTDELLLHEFGDPTASVEFAQQQALQFRIENRTSDPGTPSTGQIWLRTDL